MLIILVSGPKQPGDRIDVYLRPLVDDLKILWKPGVPEVWNEYKREEFTSLTCHGVHHHQRQSSSLQPLCPE
jgi:hypothetical protein